MSIWVILFMVGVVALLALAFRSRPSVSETDKRQLKNLEHETKLEGFLSHYPRLRSQDFEGAFALHNSSQDIWYVGSSPQVYRTVMDLFSEDVEPRQIRADAIANDHFSIRAIPLAGSVYPDRDQLRWALRATYAEGKRNY